MLRVRCHQGEPLPGVTLNVTRSASIGADSFPLEQLRRLLKDAYDKRETLKKEISSAAIEANTATHRYQKWKRGFLMRRLRKKSFAARKRADETAAAKLEELQEQLRLNTRAMEMAIEALQEQVRLTTLAMEVMFDRDQAKSYYRLRDDFAALSTSQKIWDLLSEQPIDYIAAERSTAGTAVTRVPVSFSLDSCDLIG